MGDSVSPSLSWMFEPLDMFNPSAGQGPGYYGLLKQWDVPGQKSQVVALGLRSDSGPAAFTRGGGAVRKNQSTDQMDSVTLAKSLSRTRTAVRDACLGIGANRMLTLTYRENMTDRKRAWRDLKAFVRRMRAGPYKGFSYVAVMEMQERGAMHMHLAVHGFFNYNVVRKCWWDTVGVTMVDGVAEKNGNVDFTAISRSSNAAVQIAGYISKYLTKSFSENSEFNKKRYSVGGDVLQPKKTIGWIALGSPISLVLRDKIYQAVHRRVRRRYESEDGLIFWAST